MIYKHPEDLGQGQFEAFQQTQVALMSGRTVLNAALRNPKVLEINLRPVTKDTPAVEWLEKEIRVTTPEGPELPRLTMSGDNPEHLKVLLQAVVDAYMEEIVGVQKRRRQERLDTLKEISVKYQDRLNRIVDARNEVAKLVGVGEERAIALKLEMGQKQLSVAQAEFIKVDGELRRLEVEAKVHERNKEDSKDEVEGGSQARLAQLHKQIRFCKEFKNVLLADILRLDEENHKLSVRPLHLESYNAEIKQKEAGVALVMGEIDRLTVEMPTPARVSPLPEGVVVMAPDEMFLKSMILGLTAVGAFVIVLIIALQFRPSPRTDGPVCWHGASKELPSASSY